MFSRLREPFGKAGLIVAVIALVAALVGGAYAANSATDSAKRHHKKKNNAGLNSKQKKQVRNIAKTEAKKVGGSEGPAGPQGPAGPAGANGNDGQNGSNGSQGPKGDKGDTGPQGPQGDPGEDGTFEPSGFTQTGVWSPPGDPEEEGYPQAPEGASFVPISFPIPLESAPELVVVKSEEDKSAEGCPNEVSVSGNLVGSPEADPGKLCVYVTLTALLSGFLTVETIDPTKIVSGATPGTSTAGTLLKIECGLAACPAGGTWAVTG